MGRHAGHAIFTTRSARYWPQLKKNSLKFNFEDKSLGVHVLRKDPRGINPPFGKTHTHMVEEAGPANVFIMSIKMSY